MRNILVAMIVLSSAAWAQKKFQPLNVKPGLWQSTSTITTSGQMPMPAEILSKLTPEQRARFEQRMKADSAPKTRTTTARDCETKEQLEKAPFSDNKECTQTLLTSTSSRAELSVVCHMGDVTSRGHMNIEALNSENVRGTGEMSATGEGHTFTSKVAFTGKWLGASCRK